MVTAQVFFMAKGIENIPFFLYHMYSQPHPYKDSVPVYMVRTNEGYFDHKKLSNREQELLMNSISYYVNLKRDGDGTIGTVESRFGSSLSRASIRYLQKHLGNDSTALVRFTGYWTRYFNAVSNHQYSSAAVYRSYVCPYPPYRLSANDSLIFSVKLK